MWAEAKAALLAAHNWVDQKTGGLRGYRTLLVAGIMTFVDVGQVTDIAPILPPAVLPYWMVLHPFLFAYLRLITRTAVGGKDQ